MCNISDAFSLFTPRCVSLSSSRSEGGEAECSTFRFADSFALHPSSAVCRVSTYEMAESGDSVLSPLITVARKSSSGFNGSFLIIRC